MTDNRQPPPQPPIDQRSIWSGMAGSIVALIMTTILSLRQTSSRCGTKMDPVLEELINTFSKDANNFIVALNKFCNSTSQAFEQGEKSCIACCSFLSEGSTSVSQQTESSCECEIPPPIEVVEQAEEPACGCEQQPSDLRKDIVCECDSDHTQRHIHTCIHVPKEVSKHKDDFDTDDDSTIEGSDFAEISEMEKAVPVCIIEDEFTEISSYTVDPITKKVKICTVEEHSQLAKCTLLKHQAIQACECTDNKWDKTAGSNANDAAPPEKVEIVEIPLEREGLEHQFGKENEEEDLHGGQLSKEILMSETVEKASSYVEEVASEASEEISSTVIEQVYPKELPKTLSDLTEKESAKTVFSSNQPLETIDETDRSAATETEKSYTTDKSEELQSKLSKPSVKENRSVSEGSALQNKSKEPSDSGLPRRKTEGDKPAKSDTAIKKPMQNEEAGKKDGKQTPSSATSQPTKAGTGVAGDSVKNTEPIKQPVEKKTERPKTPDLSKPSSKNDSRRSSLPVSIGSGKGQAGERPATPGGGSVGRGGQPARGSAEKPKPPTEFKDPAGAWKAVAAPRLASSEKTVTMKTEPVKDNVSEKPGLNDAPRSLRDEIPSGITKQSSQSGEPVRGGGMGKPISSGIAKQSNQPGEPIKGGGIGKLEKIEPMRRNLLGGPHEVAGKGLISREGQSGLNEKEKPKQGGEYKQGDVLSLIKKESEKDKEKFKKENSLDFTTSELVGKQADKQDKIATEMIELPKHYTPKVTPFIEEKELESLERFAQGFVSSLSQKEKLECMADYIRRNTPGLSERIVRNLVEASHCGPKRLLEPGHLGKPARGGCGGKHLEMPASGSTSGLKKKSKQDTSLRPCLCPPQRGIKEGNKGKEADSCACPSRCGSTTTPESNPHMKDWSKRLCSAGQTLASLREKITDFNRALTRSDDHRSTPDTQIRKRQERSQSYPLPSGSLPCTTTTCPCPAIADEHGKVRYSNMMRPMSPKKASRVNVNSTLLGHPPSVGVQPFPHPLMPQEAIPVQPGYLTDSSKRPRSSRTRARTSKVDFM
ncbi:hypothetical protein ILUMI_25775 [Ignelater luminosus]|uniref:Uncharacterized protein n=1 Tax=Ignelater luminosus TaxID=2038154 RepID=A0A8K0FXP4_IGNLU|nr:hypothetical protein ILUMI_25775 [Ignelater luminosus]